MNFIDYKMAIGILVTAGFTVSLKKTGDARLIIANGEVVTIPVFRDGTTWKVKEEAVQEWISDYDWTEKSRIERTAADAVIKMKL